MRHYDKHNPNFVDRVLMRVQTAEYSVRFTTYSPVHGRSKTFSVDYRLVVQWASGWDERPYIASNHLNYIKLVRVDEDTVRVCITWCSSDKDNKLSGYVDDIMVDAKQFCAAVQTYRTTVTLLGSVQPSEHTPHIVLSTSGNRSIRKLREESYAEFHAAVRAITKRFDYWGKYEIRISSPYVGCFNFVCVQHDGSEPLAGLLLLRKDSRLGKDRQFHPAYSYVMRTN